jgi:hypothetical protein
MPYNDTGEKALRQLCTANPELRGCIYETGRFIGKYTI